jgi:D-tagatose-bisphosphate aldolase class II non-catalytic subunit
LPKIATLGEVLVEIMATGPGDGFRDPLELVGPFPSGAPAIFIDQVAKLGAPCGIIAAVGDDDFGRANITRLGHDGVDTSGIEVRSSDVTATAFVRYRHDGQRDFIFNLRNSAAGKVELSGPAREMLDECGHLHLSGSSLFSSRMVTMANQAIALVKARGGSVSFDPNIRTGVEPGSAAHAALRGILVSCDMFLPSGPEVTLLTKATNRNDAIKEILDMGVSCVVVKHGPGGSSYHDGHTEVWAPGYTINEVDPTGAGDCFDAAFMTCRLQGREVKESLEYANAAGALAVAVRGPMEGTSTFAQLDELRAGRHSAGKRRLDGLFASEPRPLSSPTGITSVCSAHPMVIEAAMLQAAEDEAPLLIEATCNQVNHQGGYTGLTPAAFREMVNNIAQLVDFPEERITLGGDHLGPSPWRRLPAEEALAEAETMVAAYAAAGYEKVHLDTSMGCKDEPEHLSDGLTAERAARLARVAEQAAGAAGTMVRYVIGTEVPTPGGALHDIRDLEVTRPEAVFATLDAHKRAFEAVGVGEAFSRVIAVVAQPGVEFDSEKVVVYDPQHARDLIGALQKMPGLVFEAHSTDYQPTESLAELVRDGFAVLKVGPGLTFAMREALYALDHIASEMTPGWQDNSLIAAMEQEMVAHPGYWEHYYPGDPNWQRIMRHFSYSDRIRYYWASPPAQQAVERLFDHLRGTTIPASLVSQFLPTLYPRVASGELPWHPKALVIEAVREVLRQYDLACGAIGAGGPGRAGR